MTITMNQMRTARNKGIRASIFESEKFIADPGGAYVPARKKGKPMEKMEMTAEELREYIKSLPENVIVRVTVLEDEDGSTEGETIRAERSGAAAGRGTDPVF